MCPCNYLIILKDGRMEKNRIKNTEQVDYLASKLAEFLSTVANFRRNFVFYLCL